jgi:hypothetical protein
MEAYTKQTTTEPLHERSPDEWLRRINELPADIQPVISRVIWWSWFGSQTRANVWTQLDKLRNLPMGDIPEIDQIKALVKLGYTAHAASKRIGVNYD